MIGEAMGGPDTGVPGLDPICRGELIIPEPEGLERGREVAGEWGFGLWTPGGPPPRPPAG